MYVAMICLQYYLFCQIEHIVSHPQYYCSIHQRLHGVYSCVTVNVNRTAVSVLYQSIEHCPIELVQSLDQSVHCRKHEHLLTKIIQLHPGIIKNTY